VPSDSSNRDKPSYAVGTRVEANLSGMRVTSDEATEAALVDPQLPVFMHVPCVGAEADRPIDDRSPFQSERETRIARRCLSQAKSRANP